jgi:hypothetical protein
MGAVSVGALWTPWHNLQALTLRSADRSALVDAAVGPG